MTVERVTDLTKRRKQLLQALSDAVWDNLPTVPSLQAQLKQVDERIAAGEIYYPNF